MDGRTDGKPYGEEDADTQVFYRFGHESSLGDGPQDPRWDVDGRSAGGESAGIASQDRWNAFGGGGDEPSHPSNPSYSESDYGQADSSYGQADPSYGQADSYGQAGSYGQAAGSSDDPSAWESTTQSWSASWGSQPESTWDSADPTTSVQWEPAPRWEATEAEPKWEPAPPPGWESTPPPRWEATPTPPQWDASQATTYGSWRPSPLNRSDSVSSAREPGWSVEPSDGRSW